MRRPEFDQPPVQLTGATKRYGEILALAGIDLAIRPGEVLALLGPNGAGKTTAVRLILGLARPDGGTVRVYGRDPRVPAHRARTGAMLQVGKVPDTLRVGELVHQFATYYGSPVPLAAPVAAAGLAGLERRPFGELSGGQQQRVLFALALAGDPDLVVLDEPTAGLDVEARRGLWQAIRGLTARGRSVLLTTHHLEEADALAHRVVVIHHGAIVAEGTPAEIKARAAGRRIRCRTALTAAEAERLPGTRSVSVSGGVLEILTSDAEGSVRELLRRDPALADLEVASAGLEEAFLALTGDERREVA